MEAAGAACGIMDGGHGPHSASIGTTASPYLGLHICLNSIACLFDHDQGLVVLQGTAVKRCLCYSVIINQWASASTLE